MAKFLLLLMCLPYLTYSQSPVIQWQNTIGGDSADEFHVIELSSDGGYLLGGASLSNISADKTENCNGVADYWLVKINSTGVIQWQNTIGGNDFDVLTDMHQTFDSGYIIGGYSRSTISGDKIDSSRGAGDYWVLKLDSIGNIQWQKTIGGSYPDYLYSLNQTADGGYILGGASSSDSSGDKTENSRGGNDYWIIKLDSLSNIEWQKTIGGNDFENLFSISQTTDRGYFLAGYSKSNISGEKSENSRGGNDYWVVKTDSIGNIQWQRTLGGNSLDDLVSAQQTSDEGYILGGYSFSNISGEKTQNSRGLDDYWIIKLNPSGVIQWQLTLGGLYDDYLNDIIQTADGGYFMGGTSNSIISGEKSENNHDVTGDYWAIKADSLGNIEWQKTIGGSQWDLLYSVQQSIDGEYILGGQSLSDISYEKTENCLGGFDYWIVKLAAPVSINENSKRIILNVYPNPVSSFCKIESREFNNATLFIYDITGRVILQQPFKTQVQLNMTSLTSGIYMALVRNEIGENIKEKIVKD